MKNMLGKVFILLGCVLVAGLLAAPLGAQATGTKGAVAQSTQADAPKPLSSTAVAAPVDPNTYKIGAGDVLDIRVWKEPELSRSVRVRPDGKITLMLVGDVQATGLTPLELQKKCVDVLSQVLNAPQVDVSVASVESKRYFVSGSVGRSGPVSLVTPTTILEAISMCGLSEWAKKSNIVIMRGAERIKFNYNQVIKGQHLEQNILLQDGDHIYVP